MRSTLHTTPRPDDGPVTVVWGEMPPGTERDATHAALLHAAADLTGAPVHRIRLDHGPGGRPRLTGPASGLRVSVSHTRGAGAVALSRHRPVGVDIETVRPFAAGPLARRWLDEASADWVARSPRSARVRAFLWLWTQKEAIGKARGHGLGAGGLTQPLPLPADTLPGPTGRLRTLPDDPRTACAVLPTGSRRHVLALAVGDV
ncbi:4'-phosphopantetheinyl transferase superfamily protein [Streptomyces caniferus]|uniref:4'-phosphopantetheinyl transferase family protein n=1 Tax=Streptomyces caniferus TaxID=285557 RepID=UPI002E2C2FF8|nr:4'-phosphopantetheinyl transferase superfamily protein [Streptomyces caniferus]